MKHWVSAVGVIWFLGFKLLLTMLIHHYNTRKKKYGNVSNDDDSLTSIKLEGTIVNHITPV